MSAIAIDVDVTELDEFLPELDQPHVDRFKEVAAGDINIRRPTAPAEKFHALLRQDCKFRLSWERRRPDLRDHAGERAPGHGRISRHVTFRIR